jgi:hypothetical protein
VGQGPVDEHAPEPLEPPAGPGGIAAKIDERGIAKPLCSWAVHDPGAYVGPGLAARRRGFADEVFPSQRRCLMTAIWKWAAVAACAVGLVAAAGRFGAPPALADDDAESSSADDALGRLDRIVSRLDRIVERMGPGGPPPGRPPRDHERPARPRRGDDGGPPRGGPGRWAEMDPEMRERMERRLEEMPPEVRERAEERMREARHRMEEGRERMEKAREKMREFESRIASLEAEVTRLKADR